VGDGVKVGIPSGQDVLVAGRGVSVGGGVLLGDGVPLGDGVLLGDGVTVTVGVTVGAGVFVGLLGVVVGSSVVQYMAAPSASEGRV
jgi:UDP-3-O-[3-hydroxymyristoyl] glucosamine N-acyltransferase